MQDKFGSGDFTVIGVAVDVQGVPAAKPWYDKHHLTYPKLVDAANNLGRAIGYTIVPNQFYVDELGIYQGRIKKSELAARLARPMQTVPADLRQRLRSAAPTASLAALLRKASGSADDFSTQLAAGEAALSAGDHTLAMRLLTRAVRLSPGSTEALTALAAADLAAGDKESAAASLRKARHINPKDWIVRKQVWAIEHPERFYDGPVDFRWQREQIRREDNPSAKP